MSSPGEAHGIAPTSTPGEPGAASPVEGLVLRALRAGDAEHLVSDPFRRALYGEWLACQERGEMYVAVAEVEGVPVASRCLNLVCGAEDVAYGFAAHVLPAWRRRGIGSAMEKHLEAVAIARGKSRMRSRAEKRNTRAIRWHEHIGDVCIGDGVTRWTEADGSEVERDCWIFERRLLEDDWSRPTGDAPATEPERDGGPEPPAVTFTFRPLRAADVDRLFEPVGRRLAAEWLRRQERGEIYVAVAEVDGASVGRITLDFTTLAAEGAGEVFAARVRPDWRSRGVARAIREHLYDVAHAKGLRVLRAVVVKGNEAAVRWHELIGDRRVGEGLRRWTEPDGTEVERDCWIYEHELGP